MPNWFTFFSISPFLKGLQLWFCFFPVQWEGALWLITVPCEENLRDSRIDYNFYLLEVLRVYKGGGGFRVFIPFNWRCTLKWHVRFIMLVKQSQLQAFPSCLLIKALDPHTMNTMWNTNKLFWDTLPHHISCDIIFLMTY